jgi:proteasome lid subunit RPN8/RPN11
MKDDFEGIDKLETTPEDETYIRRVYELGADAQEHGIALIDGVAHEFTSDLEHKVFIPEKVVKLLDEKGAKDVTLYHNHPNGTAPSGGDLEQLLRNRVKAVYTIGSNGNIHKVEVGNGTIPSLIEFKNYRLLTGKEIDRELLPELKSGDISIEKANYIFAKEQAYRLIRKYKWLYEGGKADEIF